MTRPSPIETVDENEAWRLLRALRECARRGESPDRPLGLRLDGEGRLEEVGAEDAWLVTRPDLPEGWAPPGPAGRGAYGPGAVDLLDLYMPLCVGSACHAMVIGHLAQTIDGRIATVNGVSRYITGDANLKHAHRMRALCDAVLVGARTVEHDDPFLTTRLVPGEHPTRVILDPRGRLRPDHRIFRDGTAPTLVVRGRRHARAAEPPSSPEPPAEHASVVYVDEFEGRMPVEQILHELRERGLRRIFIEGGGVTVSRFLQAGALDRLHVAVAPLIMGSGRPAFSLPTIERLEDAMRLRWRSVRMGNDVLFDCAFA
jgi:diaminohydroxyphosphoribosylaminopyrimidine deaminase / 5-amino-6-(5-phosphoribosylamino)uracil reductase